MHVTGIFFEYQTGAIADHGFEAMAWPSLNRYIFKRKFSLLPPKCIFKGSLYGSDDLGT